MKIGAIVVSLRKKSANRVLFEKLQALMPAGVEVYEIRTDDIGLFNQDNEFPTPDNILRLRDEFSRADGVWLFTPEYNHSYPAHVKNIIDWLSRPLGPGQGNVIAGKPMTSSGVGHGKSGTTSVQDKLIELLGYLRVDLMTHPRVAAAGSQKHTGEDGIYVPDEATLKYLQKQAEAFQKFITARQSLNKGQ